ncbi:UNVERIFIED_CONTAM: hypothetical protein GTU68_037511 [Idotea baltica]|nr:hypothetical protein [Idotea baltica]
MEKMAAHQKGLLHRAFSIFIFNDKNELLLQQRALSKYHSAGLWTNTCCSHPRENENLTDATARRLQEEMGFTCPVEKAFHFTYYAELENNLIENELDHVFIGLYNGDITINPTEVEQYKYEQPDWIQKDMTAHPEKYTAWFKIVFSKVLEHMHSNHGTSYA